MPIGAKTFRIVQTEINSWWRCRKIRQSSEWKWINSISWRREYPRRRFHGPTDVQSFHVKRNRRIYRQSDRDPSISNITFAEFATNPPSPSSTVLGPILFKHYGEIFLFWQLHVTLCLYRHLLMSINICVISCVFMTWTTLLSSGLFLWRPPVPTKIKLNEGERRQVYTIALNDSLETI